MISNFWSSGMLSDQEIYSKESKKAKCRFGIVVVSKPEVSSTQHTQAFLVSRRPLNVCLCPMLSFSLPAPPHTHMYTHPDKNARKVPEKMGWACLKFTPFEKDVIFGQYNKMQTGD